MNGYEKAFPLVNLMNKNKKREHGKNYSRRRKEKQAILDKCNSRCYYCGLKVIYKLDNSHIGHPFEMTIDHVDPIALGGSRSYWGNMVAACRWCNNLKADMTLEGYREFLEANIKNKKIKPLFITPSRIWQYTPDIIFFFELDIIF